MLPVHLATAHGAVDFFKLMLNETDKQLRYRVMQGTAGPSLDGRTRAMDLPGERGRTPLMLATEAQAWAIFHYLLEAECDLTPAESTGGLNAL